MRVLFVTPAPRGSRLGNRVTAERWARLVRQLGHAARVSTSLGGDADVLVALHARRSHRAVMRFRRDFPGRPLVVAVTGTDVYGEGGADAQVLESFAAADRIVVLQRAALDVLPAWARDRARVVFQSAEPPPRRALRRGAGFQVAVLAHLRAVKDPFLAAAAVRLLPPDSRVRVLHAGAVLDPGMELRAREESASNPRWRWVGDLPHARALRLLDASRATLSTSRHEGGAGAVSEAVACGVPLLATRIAGTVGLLGEDYPGWFEPGDAEGLARLLRRAETEPAFLDALRAALERVAPDVRPEAERERLRELLDELAKISSARTARGPGCGPPAGRGAP